ncbi:MAG: hypothetical protein AB1349_08040 [Elusimicrobiota bacterium]
MKNTTGWLTTRWIDGKMVRWLGNSFSFSSFHLSIFLFFHLAICLYSLEKGDLVFRNSPDPNELFNPHHVAISVDGRYKIIGAENEHYKTKNKKIVLKKVEYTDLRDYAWQKFRVERSTSVLNSSPSYRALPEKEQKKIRDRIVEFAIKQHSKKFNHPIEDGLDNNPDSWYCSELTNSAYNYGLLEYPEIAKEINLPLTPWEQFNWEPDIPK